MSLSQNTVLLDADRLRLLFPAHLIVDGKQMVTAVGPSAARRFAGLRPGVKLDVFFDIAPGHGLAALAASGATVTLTAREGAGSLRGLVIASGADFTLLVGHVGPADAPFDLGSADLGPDDFSVAGADAATTRALQKAHADNRIKSEFLASISHELRTPLHGVIGIIGSLGDSELTDAQAEMVSLIEESGVALTRVVEEVLDFVRLETDSGAAVEGPFVLEQELARVADEIDSEADIKGLELMVEFDVDPKARFIGDAPRIRKILANLLASAIRVTAQGEIGLSARIGGSASKPKLLVEVSDGNPDLDAETAAGLLQRITTGAASMASTPDPHGFSLTICKALVDQIGGEISVHSTLGEGSVFSLTLPLRPATRAEAKALENTAPPIPAPRSDSEDDNDDPVRALVAEDHPANRRIIELMLAPMGVEVTLVANGAEAVEAFKKHDWELILLDMQMPVLDGISAARAMRDLESGLGRARTPIAMLSANVLPRHVDEALAAGVDHFIAKPVTPSALAHGLDELVRAAAVNAAKTTSD